MKLKYGSLKKQKRGLTLLKTANDMVSLLGKTLFISTWGKAGKVFKNTVEGGF
jgi:hypothetical protein